MPYIIAVLALIILGAGFTLFQQSNTPTTLVADDSSQISTTTASAPQTETELVPQSSSSTIEEVIPNSTPTTADTPNTAKPTPPPVPTTNQTPAPADSNTYTNGTYSTTKSYRTPDGTYQMNLSITINNDTVTGSSITFDEKGAQSGYSKRFNSSYQSQVIGKDLGSISVSRVSGASLTTNAFNSALADIRNQAS